MVSWVRRRTAHLNWKMRYWVLDKYHDQLRGVAFASALVIAAVYFVLSVKSAVPMAAHRAATSAADYQPQAAWVQVAVQVVIMIVAMLIAYAMRPKITTPEPADAEAPEAGEGGAAVRIYGTEWVAGTWLGWKKMGRDPIRKGGGK